MYILERRKIMSKIAIYAGHGGRDSGAVGQNGELEKNYTLKIAQAAIRTLEAAGHTAITNRTSDADRDITADAARANAENVDCVAEIHLNSNAGTPGTGTEVYYSASSERGRGIAMNILGRIAALGYGSRGVKTKLNSAGKDYFGIIRQTAAPAVLVEVCFINSPEDMARLDTEAAGRAVAEGITAIFGGAAAAEESTAAPLPAGETSQADERRRAKTAELQHKLNVCYGAGLAEDGIWGPKTATACNSRLLKYKTPMMRTTYVMFIQQLLGAAGFGTDVDGAYGPKTKAQVTAYQRSVGLSADGIVGKNTCKALIETYAERQGGN